MPFNQEWECWIDLKMHKSLPIKRDVELVEGPWLWISPALGVYKGGRRLLMIFTEKAGPPPAVHACFLRVIAKGYR
jgi:hypothetical protein